MFRIVDSVTDSEVARELRARAKAGETLRPAMRSNPDLATLGRKSYDSLTVRTVYIETSIASYLTARASRDLRAAAWQQTTIQWWEQERPKYELFTSELVLVEARAGDTDAAQRRLAALNDLLLLGVTDDAKDLADRLMADGVMPVQAAADALHVAVASVHRMDYLLTWNCRHIDNAATKPLIRSICAVAGYVCPEICTPLELLSEEVDDV